MVSYGRWTVGPQLYNNMFAKTVSVGRVYHLHISHNLENGTGAGALHGYHQTANSRFAFFIVFSFDSISFEGR